MRPHVCVPISDPSQVGEARRLASRLAEDAGFDETVRGRLALIVTELANNLAQHARHGQALIGLHGPDEAGEIDVLSIDRGPGMADVTSCLRDGYSTGGTPGTGFGAVQRLADTFSVFSVPEQGTVILARVRARPAAKASVAAPWSLAAIALAAPGESVSGDAWSFRDDGRRATVMVVDGLGHGPDAAVAAKEALASFDRQPDGSPAHRIEEMHGALRGTRGAAVAIASLDVDAGTIVFAGAGNIAGRIVSGVSDRSLLSQHGTVGLQIRRMQDVSYPWPDHAMLVLHSDGLTSRWNLDDARGLLQCDPAVIAGWIIGRNLRGRDDATVVVVRRASKKA